MEPTRGPLPARIVVHGPSGSGKTTTAATMARAMRVPHLELDSLFHQPGWTELDTAEFRQIVDTFATMTAWVCDGNYRAVRDILWSRADLVVIIDRPRRVVMRRLVARSLRRVATRADLWNGNRESVRNLVSRDPKRNIILWAWRTHEQFHRELPIDAAATVGPDRVVVLRRDRDIAALIDRHRRAARI